MEINWGFIKFLVLTSLVVFLFSFSKERNISRSLNDIGIEFIDDKPPFITLNTVNKLLIQNDNSITSIDKETLVLNELELRLLKNPMISDAEVFVTIDGKLGANIVQRNPIARISGTPNYYLDDEGEKMPLSTVYAARVPLITGSSNNNFKELTPLLLRIQEDSFMKSIVVGMHEKNDGNVELRLRKNDFRVSFGKPIDMDRKFQNFKAFYHKTKSDKKLTEYSLVNLQFGNQVVATKK